MAENPQLSVLTHENFVKDVISDGVLETNVFLNELKSRNRLKFNKKGTSLKGVVRKGRIGVEGWSGLDEPDAAQPDIHDNWTHEWGGFYASYYLSEWDKLANSGDKEAYFNMQEEYLDSMKEDFSEIIEDYCFLDGLSESPRKWGGLAAYTKQTGNYGGLAQTNTFWKAQKINGAASTSVGGTFNADLVNESAKKMLTRLGNECTVGASRDKKNRPDAGFMDRPNWNFIHDRIETQRRVVANKEKLKLGHTNFVWDGIDYFWSDSCQAQKVWLINFSYLELCCQTPKLFKSFSSEVHRPLGELHQAVSKGQFVHRSPRFCGVISATGVT